MRRHRFGRGRPPWWPENEPWPPRSGFHDRRVTRLRFFRRLASLAIVALTFSVAGVWAITWFAATALGIAGPMGRGGAALLITGGVMGVVVAAGFVVVFMRRVGMPFGAVMEAAERVAAGDYSVRVDEHGPPPVRAMARAFNTMTGRLQDHDRQRRDMMADIAHELRTPLTIMQGKLEGLLDGVYPRDDSHLTEVLEETHILSRLIEDLRTVALTESGALNLQKESTDVVGLGRDVVRAFAGEAAERQVALTVDAPADVAPIPIDPLRIREVLANLVSNAVRHTPAGGSVDVRVTATPNGDVSVAVHDNGVGMTREDLARAFDRFHKGPESRGSGLGLTIAKSLVEAHGGTIRASSERGAGTTLTFTLPGGR